MSCKIAVSFMFLECILSTILTPTTSAQTKANQEKKVHILLPAEFVDVKDDTRFLVTQDKDQTMHFQTTKGLYGGFAKYGAYSHRGRIFSIGAQYVIQGTVKGFLGFEFESDKNFPLVFQSEKAGLRYLCGKGSAKDADGKTYIFDAGTAKEWSKKLRDGKQLERRAAAQALGWIGTPNDQKALLSALSDKDIIVRGLAAESLMRIGDKKAIKPLKDAISDITKVIEKLDAETDVGNGSYIGRLDVSVKPFETWNSVRMTVSGTGEVQDERVAKHMWVRSTYEKAVTEIEKTSK